MIPNSNYPFFMQNQMMQNAQQAQVNSLITVPSEAAARNYPVAYGHSVILKDETAPYIYSKTMGFSQLDKPVFEKYKLIKEETTEVVPAVNNEFDMKFRFDEIDRQMKTMWAEIESLRGKRRRNDELTTNDKQLQTKSSTVLKTELQRSDPGELN